MQLPARWRRPKLRCTRPSGQAVSGVGSGSAGASRRWRAGLCRRGTERRPSRAQGGGAGVKARSASSVQQVFGGDAGSSSSGRVGSGGVGASVPVCSAVAAGGATSIASKPPVAAEKMEWRSRTSTATHYSRPHSRGGAACGGVGGFRMHQEFDSEKRALRPAGARPPWAWMYSLHDGQPDPGAAHRVSGWRSPRKKGSNTWVCCRATPGPWSGHVNQHCPDARNGQGTVPVR